MKGWQGYFMLSEKVIKEQFTLKSGDPDKQSLPISLRLLCAFSAFSAVKK
jgi:hypothetical protein